MVAPTAEQRAALAAHEKVSVVGAHTVGAPDGGEGLPGVGWSTHHGDLRIPHFLGLHALQLVPFLGWIIGRMRRGAALVFVAAGSYVTLFALLVWQALRGHSILEPDSTTLIALACWVGLTALFAIVAGRKTENYDTRAAVLSM